MTPEAHPQSAELAAYLMDGLEPAERRRFESHLAGCEICREQAEDLGGVPVALAQMSPPAEPPVDLTSGVMTTVQRAATSEPDPDRQGDLAAEPATSSVRLHRRTWLAPRRVATALAGAAVIAVAVFAGNRIADDGDPAAPVELAGSLTGEGGQADLVVRALGSGREVRLESDDLPVLPKDELYELWFVGSGDTPGSPNRISAGTFHPDEAGRTAVVLHAAVDPSIYPRVEVTAEPGNGSPAVDGPSVMDLDR